MPGIHFKHYFLYGDIGLLQGVIIDIHSSKSTAWLQGKHFFLIFAEFSRAASAYMLMILSIDRQAVIRNPLSVSHWRTTKTARRVMVTARQETHVQLFPIC